jgi:phosphoglycerate dehydrogenase-like enzyme
MPAFKVLYSGDYLNSSGQFVRPDMGLDLLQNVPFIQTGFMLDQAPQPNDPGYSDRLYSLEVTADHVAGANGLIICRPWVKPSAFSYGAANLVAIGRGGAGYDKIDVVACTANDVLVFNSPNSLVHSTAAAALTFILALAKRLPEHERMARTGCWDRQAEITGDDLPGMTLGIVGLGHTGAELARLIAPFKMQILAFSPRADAAKARELGVTLVPSLADIFRESDFISLHCRLEPHTHNMIGEREFWLMKSTAYFINVARGELVQQEAMVRGLREGWIRGAALDVFREEPLPADDPLTKLDNVILAPHWLPATRQACYATQASVAEGMRRVASGLLPDNILNPAVLERTAFRAKLKAFAENSNSVQDAGMRSRKG